jgi:hypothetical protein
VYRFFNNKVTKKPEKKRVGIYHLCTPDFNKRMPESLITEIYKTMLLFTPEKNSNMSEYITKSCHYSYLNGIILQRKPFKTFCVVEILAVKISIVTIK